MPDNEHDFTIDPDLVDKPVTRVELWRAMAMLRRMGLDLHMTMLSLNRGDKEKIDYAHSELDKVGKDIDAFMDNLLGLQEKGEEQE